VRFVGFFLDPVYCLVGTGKLADTTELPAVEIPKPAIGAALRPVKLGYNDTLAVGFFPFPENFIRAHLCTEVAALAPGFVDGNFHESAVLSYYIFIDLYKKPIL
jgi:hypothetical protein